MVPTVAFLPFAALGFLEPPVDLEITLEVVEQHKGLERWKDVQNVQTILVCFTIDINCLGIHELPPCSCGKNSMRTKNWLYAANVHPPLEVFVVEVGTTGVEPVLVVEVATTGTQLPILLSAVKSKDVSWIC